MTIDYSQLTPEQMNSMSDEDFAKIDPTKLPNTSFVIEESQGDDEPQYIPEQTAEVPQVEGDQPLPDVETPPEPELANEGVPTVIEGEAEAQAGTVPNEAGEAKADPTKEATTPAVTDTPKSKSELFMEKVTGKFTASGREYTVDNEDDVVS